MRQQRDLQKQFNSKFEAIIMILCHVAMFNNSWI